MRCPRCTFFLHVLDHQGVELDHCPRCRGTFLDPGETTALFGAAMEPEAWTEAWPTEDLGPTRLRCPKDGDLLHGHRVTFSEQQVEVDTCPQCKGLWVDANEARALKAIIDAAQNEAARKSQGLDRPGLGSYLFQLFTGMPVEAWNPVRTRPVIMHTVFGALILFFVMQVVFREGLNEDPGLLMLVPAEVMHGQHLWTLVSAAFLHGGLAHLLGNLYFLWVFGDNVEDALGPSRFIALYAVALLAGALLHLVTNAASTLPMLGASGAIAGIMGAYMVLFPKVRVYVMLLVFRINIGVLWYLGFWIAMQFVMVALGGQGVAWMAHIGGFIAGAGMAIVFRKSARYSALLTPQRVGTARA